MYIFWCSFWKYYDKEAWLNMDQIVEQLIQINTRDQIWRIVVKALTKAALMPVLAQTYHDYLAQTKQPLYTSKQVRIPEPELYVIYTGDRQEKYLNPPRIVVYWVQEKQHSNFQGISASQ